MRRYPGVVTGVVKSLKDPDGQGRVQLEFPWLEQSFRSAWAPIATPLGGKDRGMFFMPEEEDEVLVAFEQGDFDHPFIVGFLWNGVDIPPDDGINASVRRIKTISGHIIDFDDNEGKEKIIIKTQGGHQLEMSDESKFVKIKSNSGQEILLDDQSPLIKMSNSGNTITMDSTGITIDTQGEVKIKGSTVNIEATGPLTAKGSPIHLNP